MSFKPRYLIFFVVIIIFTIIYYYKWFYLSSISRVFASNSCFNHYYYLYHCQHYLLIQIEANIDDEQSGKLEALRFNNQNTVECRGHINTGSRICLPYTFNIDGNVTSTFNLINETMIPTGEWKFKCSAIKQGGASFLRLYYDFALNADGSDKDKIDFSYRSDDADLEGFQYML